MVSYDERVIVEFAEKLYRRARSLVVTWTLLGGVLAALLGWLVGAPYAMRVGNPAVSGDLIGIAALVGALVGYVAGRERAFALRLQAQIALCQAQIERNTRGVVMTGVAPQPYQIPPPPPFQVPR
jgi:hypothetical protein